MNKIVNKIMCFVAVFVLCVPLLCFSVRAEDSLIVGNSLKSLETSLDNYYFDNDIDEHEELLNFSNVYYKLTSPIRKYSIPFSKYNPLFSIYNFSGYKDINNDYCDLKTLENLYYISFSSGDSISTYKQCILYSDSPIFLIQNDSYITFTSSTNLCYGCFYFKKDYEYYELSAMKTSKGSSSYGDALFSDRLPIKYNTSVSSLKDCLFTIRCDYEDYSSITWDNIYSNCGNIDTSLLPNVSDSNFRPFDSNLSDSIDVKLTPDFDYDMDRFDSTTNQNEYFKFEITNNSSDSIQWLACIYDRSLLTSDTMYIDSLSNWTYMCKESYYNSLVKEDKGVFRTTWTYDGALNTGSYYYHVLLPGESYSDIIYWENVKISANKIYTFSVNAFFTDLNNPTENINPVVTGESSDLHSVTKCTEDYFKTILNYNGSTDGYRTIESCVFSKEFSVLTIPTFTTTVRNGNSIPNGGSNDAYKQRQNYETQSNINGMNTKINKNYVDPTILANSLNDVDIDFNNIGVDDVKGYIDYSQDFFKLIKMSFQTFPAIWTLVVFGLTAIIVIAIIRYIRG